MYLKHLHLWNFRNYREQALEFTAPKTILLGNNAQGKSNLLEAVEILATLRSHRCSRDRDLVLNGADTGRIAARIQRLSGDFEAAIVLRIQGRRTLTKNGENLRRQIDFLGGINAVEFSCLDLDLVRGTPEVRRNWLDTILMQVEPIYAHLLQEYERVLKQRNALLKNNIDRSIDPIELNLWDDRLIKSGVKVIRRRARIVERLLPIATKWHREIGGKMESLNINYLANIEATDFSLEAVIEAFQQRLQLRRVAELNLGTTVVGPHRDDIQLTIDSAPAKLYGSQGQQRTLVLSLKLAELELVEQIVGEPPLLLLDDVLAELDLERQERLLTAIEDRFQTIVTTTHLGNFDDRWLKSSQILQVSRGSII